MCTTSSSPTDECLGTHVSSTCSSPSGFRPQEDKHALLFSILGRRKRVMARCHFEQLHVCITLDMWGEFKGWQERKINRWQKESECSCVCPSVLSVKRGKQLSQLQAVGLVKDICGEWTLGSCASWRPPCPAAAGC